MSSILFLKIFKNWYNIQQQSAEVFSSLGEIWGSLRKFSSAFNHLAWFLQHTHEIFYSSKFKNALVESIKQEIFMGAPCFI